MANSSTRVAVVGSGIAGLTAAWVCARSGAHVTLYEADDRLGGHADTHRVVDAGRELAIDTGFIVHNRRTYPVLCRLFDELGVATQPSEMSMSIVAEASGLEWAGARGIRGIFPERARLTDIQHWRMLLEVPRFHRAARRLLAEGETDDEPTLDEFLNRHRFSPRLRRLYIEALVAAVWSTDPELAGQYPARYLFSFLANHGMLSVFGSPQWRTVTGGSAEYVQRVAKQLPDVRTSTAVVSVGEDADGVSVTDTTGSTERFDRVIIATHPQQALRMLASATALQTEVLSAMPYSANPAILHTDSRIMPRTDGAQASWNLRLTSQQRGAVTVTYDLTRLMRLDTGTRHLVTLGGGHLVDPSTVVATMDYEHPLYTRESVAAQRRLPQIDTPRIGFAGAYHGWGFHEDGARSGLNAARRFGFDWPAVTRTASSGRPPAVYETTVSHRRRQPWSWGFRQRSYIWVVDLDAQLAHQERLPRWRRFVEGSLSAHDHFGESDSIRTNLAQFLALHGIELGDASVTVMTHPRAFGYCFNPISVWWCTRTDGIALTTVVEVHNTYGDRHAYLLPPVADDGSHDPSQYVDKAMYVSPFHGVDGRYRVRAPRPDEKLDVRVTLDLTDGPPFNAAITGHRVAGHTVRAAVSAVLDRLAITAHGITLWARRLPVQPRPDHHQAVNQKGAR